MLVALFLSMATVFAKSNEQSKIVRTGDIPLCGTGLRITCIVDGDTFWLERVKYRLAGLDAPEVNARCVEARMKSAEATAMLQGLVSGADVKLTSVGLDRYQRILVTVSANGVQVVDVMVQAGVAVRWTGRRHDWC